MEEILFSIGAYNFTYNHLVGLILSVITLWLINGLITRWFLPKVTANKDIEDYSLNSAKRNISVFLGLCFILIVILFLGIDADIFKTQEFTYRISHIIKILLTIQGFRILFWFVTDVIIHGVYANAESNPKKHPVDPETPEEHESLINRIFKNILIVLAIIFLLNLFNVDYSLFSKTLESGEIFNFRISNILISILIFLVAQLFIWMFLKVIMFSVYKRKKVELGAQFAINQLFKYVVYIFATIFVLDNLGLNISILLGGAAALLVGIGLGLQQTFNDFIAGLVLLFERTVAVGDVLEIGSIIGTVERIGLRSSIVKNRANVSIMLPNSKLVNDNVINWTHFDTKVRFELNVGVAYGSDTKLVKDILLATVSETKHILKYPVPFVRFSEFGNSSLDFKLFFFTRQVLIIEDIKSEIRFNIDAEFRKHNISIPFPQTDVWLRKDS